MIVILWSNPPRSTSSQKLTILGDPNTRIRAINLLSDNALTAKSRHLWKLSELDHHTPQSSIAIMAAEQVVKRTNTATDPLTVIPRVSPLKPT